MKSKKVIYNSLIISCVYYCYKLTGFYVENLRNFSFKKTTYFAVIIQYLRQITAIFIGWITDRYMPSKLIIPSFFILTITSVIFGIDFFNQQFIFLSFTIFIMITFVIYSLRGLYFAIIEETKTSIEFTETLVGIISVIGFTPDIFNGYILGENATIIEYQNLFITFTIIPIIGLLPALGLKKSIKNE
ncbi:hypothetical protein [Polaribacter sp. Asnod6-C07]|uniref:hypothetical protein n=1 Tax=Polaribacter sp. Asnod6-C07 TaxID=3160582 RepID=UPI00386A91A0